MGEQEEPLPPFLFAARTQPERRRLARLKTEKRIRSIGPRLYTSLPEAGIEQEVRNGWSTIVAGLFPGALVSHRTALDYVTDDAGYVFLTAHTNRTVSYAGLHLEFVRGPDPLPDDGPFIRTLRTSSLPRALLENFSKDARLVHPRTLSAERIEDRLERLLRDKGGEVEINAIRDRAKEIAGVFGWRSEYERLDGVIGALLGTRSKERLVTKVGLARARGASFDTACLQRLQLLIGELRTRALSPETDVATSAAHVRNKAFFQAYFSNYIEGTKFEIEEAESIVFEKKIPAARPQDAHDVMGTFTIVSDPTEMRRTPGSVDEMLGLLRSRHEIMLRSRPEVLPGAFKVKPNHAGETHFVLPEDVVGTLQQGFELYVNVSPGLPRAIFMMFLITDVHPFADGNGRIARIMMNAELEAVHAPTIIIPTVYRDDYLRALKALTQRRRTTPIVDALVTAARFSRLDFSEYSLVLADLQRRHWFSDPDDARIDAS